ncbi:E3 ubiquitin-protein ligase parkin [Octopus bimaculoides]|uniref:Parkin RING/Ubox like zinc-binding domain-containing protein n=1 Tax=Octopus bimaculoides TaxID=37653 RepID=A0A0L8GMD8_OCTBM|nr:E3 ubiquitin-protein ligase parkin [Octopus bimaculoides]|eukprot:XP_014779687.1 PREDICTED: E3 ubiquitin-protein ligase parkin-like [Octopus bimaculoides]
MAHKGQTSSFEVNVCYQERTSSLLASNNMTVGSFLPIAVNFFLHEKGSIERYKIIYAGSVLKNEVLLKDLHLCSASVLHMVNTEKKNQLSSQNQSKEVQYSQYSYYVYCYECKDIASAQLRIKCLQCNQCQRFLIDKEHEPKCREDILSCDKSISGVCNYPGCTGRKAKYEFYCRKHPKKNSVLLKHIFNNSQHYSCITCEGDL